MKNSLSNNSHNLLEVKWCSELQGTRFIHEHFNVLLKSVDIYEGFVVRRRSYISTYLR